MTVTGTPLQVAFHKCEELISSFAAVQNPGLYDGRQLFAIWVRQFAIPAGFSTSFVYSGRLSFNWHLFASFLSEARQAIARMASFFSQYGRHG